MIKNYLKIASRYLLRNRLISMINITGLVVGIAGSLLIGLFVLDELEYDQHFAFKDRIYRLTSTYENNGTVYHSAQTLGNIASNFQQQFPEVQNVTRILPADEGFIFSNEIPFKEKIIYTDPAFINVFDLALLLGDKQSCLTKPSSIIINKTTAIKLFGEDWRQAEIIGETLDVDGKIPFQITGVFNDLPDHMHFNSNLFASVASGFEDWMNDKSKVYTYVLLHENSNANDLVRKLESENSLFNASGEDYLTKINLQPVTSIHLFSSFEDENAIVGNIKNIYALILVAFFIMVTTVSNFASLYTASSFNRLKEVGVRKTIGALGIQIRNQFFTETFLIAIIALGIAIILVICFLPLFNEVTGKKLFVKSLLNERVLYLITGLTLTTSLLAGFYPSIYLSTTRTIEALKGVKKGMSNGINWRMGLIVLQFSISTIMIVLSVVAYKQIRLINNKHLGFDKENSMTLANPYMLGSTDKILGLKNELLRIPGVENVSITGYTPSQNRWGNLKITFPDRDEKSIYAQTATWLTVDEGFIETMGLNLVAGRNFFEDHEHDKEAVIINEKAVSLFKLGTNGKSVIGAELSFNDIPENPYQHYTVVGVVADFNFGSLHDPIKPIVMKLGYHRFEMAVRLSPVHQKAEIIDQMESMWKKHLPTIPFEFYFIKDRYDKLHESDVTARNVFSFFCLVTVILSVLGLFSMVTYTIVNRTKEIGIRKLLGASKGSIVLLLTSQFAKLVMASYILGLPIAWMLSNKWLADFVYKTEISWWVYTGTGLILILLTIVTVGYQTVRAALANPVDNLRHE